eukprot:3336031-Amphidinium_carterae.1
MNKDHTSVSEQFVLDGLTQLDCVGASAQHGCHGLDVLHVWCAGASWSNDLHACPSYDQDQ